MKAVLIRIKAISNEHQTCGRLIVIDDNGEVLFQCAALELPWKNNLPQMSCIPAGTYQVVKNNSPKFGAGTYEVMRVPGRSSIRIHQGNYTRQIEGCILVGEKFTDIDNDTITDVTNSMATLTKLKAIANQFELIIMWI